MPLPLEIAWRYLRRPTDRLVSAVGAVSVLGLVIGVMALVISMALMTGYRGDLQKKLLGGNAEIFVYGAERVIEDTDGIVRRILVVPGVAGAHPTLFQQALVTSEMHTTGEQVMIKGVEVARAKSSSMIVRVIGPRRSFALPDGTRGVAVGNHLAKKLGVGAGSHVTLTVPTESGGSFLPRNGPFIVGNVYETGFFEFDSRWIFLDIADARELLGVTRNANMIEIDTVPGHDLDEVVAGVAAAVGDRYAVTDWRQMNRQLFSMLQKQQFILFVVFGLIVFVSTFNIVSTLIMTVHEKRREVGILMSMGADQRFVRAIFIFYGTLVGVLGTTTGLLLGVVVSWVITRFELVSFGPEISEVYFVSSIPFITRWEHLALIAVFAVTVSFLATLIPSARAARLSPVDSLRYE
jgi:lipoprotein-releasing system permease protein